MSQEQYAALSPEQQASYWAQWQAYYGLYPQQHDYATQYQQQVMMRRKGVARHAARFML